MSNTIDFAFLKQTIYNWIVSKISDDVVATIWANQNAPAPDGLYVTLYLLSRLKVGQDYIGKPDTDGNADIFGNREITLSIQAFGAGAYQALADLEEAIWYIEDGSQFKSFLAFIDTKGVKDITAVIGSSREERASLDVRLRIGAPFVELIPQVDVGVIEKIQVIGDVGDQQVTVDNLSE